MFILGIVGVDSLLIPAHNIGPAIPVIAHFGFSRSHGNTWWIPLIANFLQQILPQMLWMSVVLLPKGAKILSPKMVNDANALIAAVSNEGRLLVFPIAELPELARGKGNKIINIPGSRLQAREEFVIDYGVISEGDSLVVHSGKRYLVMKAKDLEHYSGERGRRGHKLPRGFQKVDKLEVEPK